MLTRVLRQRDEEDPGFRPRLADASRGEPRRSLSFAQRVVVKAWGDDRHHFRFIVSPENAHRIEDLPGYTRSLMATMERDLGTRLDWVAIDHHNTDNPHTHVLVRGRDETCADLVIARDYIANGLRHRAAERATELLGERGRDEIRHRLERDVRAARAARHRSHAHRVLPVADFSAQRPGARPDDAWCRRCP